MSRRNGDAKLPEDGRIPIRTLANLTGVNPVTLRAWERRYNLLQPARTPKGHRLYSMADVELIQQVLALLESGMAIGQVREVVEREQNAIASDGPCTEDTWSLLRQRLMAAVESFDENALNEIYQEALSLYPVDSVTLRLITPTLRELGQRWQTRQTGGVAEEHFFSGFLRNKLGARLHHRTHQLQGPKLITACLPGEQHEVGLLLFALAITERHYRPVVLGANMPLAELPEVQHRVQGCGIVLSGSVNIHPQVLENELPRLVQQSPVPVLVGGGVLQEHTALVLHAGAVALGEDLHLGIRRLEAVLKRHRTSPTAVSDGSIG